MRLNRYVLAAALCAAGPLAAQAIELLEAGEEESEAESEDLS